MQTRSKGVGGTPPSANVKSNKRAKMEEKRNKIKAKRAAAATKP